MIAFVVAALMAACGGGGGSAASVTDVPVAAAPTASRVGINGTAELGQLLTGVYTYADANNDPQGTSTFRWLRNGVTITGATARTYTLIGEDQGSTITFEVTPVSTVMPTTGMAVASSATEVPAAQAVPAATSPPATSPPATSPPATSPPATSPPATSPPATSPPAASPPAASPPATSPPAASPPAAGSVAISGIAQVGQQLTGNFTYADTDNDPQGASTFRWMRSGLSIAGATARTYTLVSADQGNTITFEVTPVATVAPTTGTPVTSSPTEPVAGVGVAAAPTAGSVVISGMPQVGQLLTGTYTYSDPNSDPQGASTFRWLRSGIAIPGATARTYTLMSADQANTITFEVTPVATVAPTTGTSVVSAAVTVTPKSVGMKLLVISAEGTLPSYLATLSILDQIGVPYDKIVLKGTNQTALQMVAGTLSDGAGNGKYQGIILETGDLAALNAGTYPSAMTAAQWAMLRQYQFAYGVRSATMYTRPAATVDVNGAPLDLTYGLAPGSARSTNDYTNSADLPVAATFTPTGAGFFSYLNTSNPVVIKNAYTYLSTPVAGPQTAVPLLTATEGGTTYAIASTYTRDGWENMAISADGNPELTHTLLLGYGIVNWVTRGVFLGERKIYLSAQPDDVFIPDELWDPVSKTTPANNPLFRHRNDATDYNSLAAWQTALRGNPQTAAFRLELPFNGVGYNTTDTAYLNQGELTDTLSPAVRANPNAFRWINHTWDHTSLNSTDPGFVTPTVQSITDQLTWNHEVATGIRSGNPSTIGPKVTFGLYNKNAFIQPDISGLENPVFWQAAQNFGLRYILMDTSKAYNSFNPPRPAVSGISPNTGFKSSLDTFVPGNPRILIIPRYPTNLFYNVSTPDEWVSEYNHFYAALQPAQGGIGSVSSYQQILDREADVLVRYMLKFNANSWMFHAANLRDYNGTAVGNNSLLSDLLDAVANKYKAMYSLPVLSPSQTQVGQIMEARMAYNAAITGGLKGRIVYGSSVVIELTNSSSVAVDVPVTGVNVGGSTYAYGGQTISTIQLPVGASTTIAVP